MTTATRKGLAAAAAGPVTGRERPLGLAARLAILGLVVAGAIVEAPSGFGLILFLPFATVGALLVVRRPQNSIGWILFGLPWGFTIAGVAVDAPIQQFTDRAVDLPLAIFVVAQFASGTVAFFMFAVLAIVFPSGRLPSGRWGRLGRAALGIGLVLVAVSSVMPEIKVPLVGYLNVVPVPNPIALWPDLAIWQVLTPDITVFGILFLVIAGAISLVVRARRARGVERQQLRWFASSIALVVLAVMSGFALSSFVPEAAATGLVWIPAGLAFPLVPIAVGIAVTRYRLYEIDRLISRGVSWAVLSGLLIGVYAGAVLLLQSLLGGVTQGETLAVAGSTLLAAALFQPLRRRIQATVDHRFNRARYDAERTAIDFAARLRDQVDLPSLSGDMAGVVDTALRPSKIGVWIRPSRPTTP